MTLSALLLFYAAPHRWVAVLASSCMACVLCWLWLRPEPV
jgi:uncharacterized membrane protein YbaN (DUF454 family)